MKAEEFKNILKPLIEKTVREVLLQEGVLSRVVSEVARGLNNTLVSEDKNLANLSSEEDVKEKQKLYEQARQKKIKKLNERAKINVFENVASIPETNSSSPLSGMSAEDSGVDISGIQKIANGKWKRLIGDKNG